MTLIIAVALVVILHLLLYVILISIVASSRLRSMTVPAKECYLIHRVILACQRAIPFSMLEFRLLAITSCVQLPYHADRLACVFAVLVEFVICTAMYFHAPCGAVL